jgi:hypothetical protein
MSSVHAPYCLKFDPDPSTNQGFHKPSMSIKPLGESRSAAFLSPTSSAHRFRHIAVT